MAIVAFYNKHAKATANMPQPSASIKALAQRDKQVVQATQLKCAAQTANGKPGRIATPKTAGTAAARRRQQLAAVLIMMQLQNSGTMAALAALALIL